MDGAGRLPYGGWDVLAHAPREQGDGDGRPDIVGVDRRPPLGSLDFDGPRAPGPRWWSQARDRRLQSDAGTKVLGSLGVCLADLAVTALGVVEASGPRPAEPGRRNPGTWPRTLLMSLPNEEAETRRRAWMADNDSGS